MHMEMLRYLGHATIIGLFFNMIFSMLLLVLINPLLRKISPKLTNTQITATYLRLIQVCYNRGGSSLLILPYNSPIPSCHLPYQETWVILYFENWQLLLKL